MQVTDQNFKQEVEDFDGVVMVDFWAEWCVPCKMLTPIMEELEKEMKDKKNVKILSLDVDHNPQTQQKFGIMSIPTVIFFKNGTPFNALVGVQSKDEYVKMIKDAQE